MKVLKYKNAGFTLFEKSRLKAAETAAKARRFQSGFTLIEVLITLTISALLAIGLLNTYTEQQRRARFSDAVERLVAGLEKVKSEVNAAYTTGGGTDIDHDFFGKVVDFPDGQTYYTVRTIRTIRANPGDPPSELEYFGDTVIVGIPWGVHVTNAACAGDPDCTSVAFIREPGDARLNAYIVATGLGLGEYNDGNDVLVMSVPLESPDGLSASVEINAGTNEVAPRYLD